MQATPAILLTGAGSAAKQAFLRALLAVRPAGEHWAIIDNDNSLVAALPEHAQLSVASINGCMCCTGQLALQTGIVQLLRRAHPQRLIIVASSAAEPVPLDRVLRQGHLARAIVISQHWFVAAPDDLTPDLATARRLRQQQLEAADMVVVADAANADALRNAAVSLGATVKHIATAAEAVLTAVPIPSAVEG